jgi:hypothetical protein
MTDVGPLTPYAVLKFKTSVSGKLKYPLFYHFTAWLYWITAANKQVFIRSSGLHGFQENTHKYGT